MAAIMSLTELLDAGLAPARAVPRIAAMAQRSRRRRRRRIVASSKRSAHSIGAGAGVKNLARHLRRFGAPPVSVRRPERFLHAAARRRLAHVEGGAA